MHIGQALQLFLQVPNVGAEVSEVLADGHIPFPHHEKAGRLFTARGEIEDLGEAHIVFADFIEKDAEDDGVLILVPEGHRLLLPLRIAPLGIVAADVGVEASFLAAGVGGFIVVDFLL